LTRMSRPGSPQRGIFTSFPTDCEWAVAPAGGEPTQFLTALAGMLETRSNGNIRNRDETLAGAHLGRTFTLLIP